MPLEQPKKQTITLKGQWLKELGFDTDVERAAMAEEETAFMEREIQQ